MAHQDVQIKKMAALRVGAVRHVGPYDKIPAAFGRFSAIAAGAHLFEQPGAMMLAIYHDDPDTVPADKLRSDAAIVVPEDVRLPEGLAEQRVAAGRYAVLLHVGPYEQLGEAWRRLKHEWLPASGQRPLAAPSYELYLNDPTQVLKHELRTEILMPLVDA
jgi:AraC family transcriptional regulator